MKPSVLHELRRIVGSENVLTQDTEVLAYGYDATVAAPLLKPDAVVLPACAEEVAAVVGLASRTPFAVVPRGAGTGLSGGARPVRGGVVLSTQRMNKILRIEKSDMQVVVQPGVVTEELQKTVEAEGLFYAPDPQSRATCTIGGNLAENAGGPRAVKYGVTRTHVLGAEAVLPQGQLVRLGARTLKSVAGYDLLSLLIGSEGTLGVFTEATLRLLPLPSSRRTLFAAFGDLEACAGAVTAIFGAGVLPSALEFMDGEAVRCVDAYQPAGLPVEAAGVLLVEVDGGERQTEADAALVGQALQQAGAFAIRRADDNRSSEALWAARRAAGPALARIAPIKFNEDIVVPLSRLPEAVMGIQRLAQKHGARCAIFGHAGDGNLHVNFLAEAQDQAQLRRVEEAVGEMFRLVVSLGGSITGEHGVGTSKKEYLSLEVGRAALEIMRAVKYALDPRDIMNPGKIFPED